MQNLPNIREQLKRKDLFDAFKMQLAKDFQQSNFPSDFVDCLAPDYSNIHEKIVSELERNENKIDSNLMQLLYRIDISEAQLKKYFNECENEKHFNVIAELIIKRVLQKVVIRQYYKGKESS
jgi:uncharacterized membrane-anchored protein YhcB (DUF1043 family)